MKKPSASFVSFMSMAFASSGLVLGCYATVSPEPGPVAVAGPAPVVATADEEVVDDPAPPAQIETYPVYVYGGQPHYYVNGRWYRKGPRGWTYYRHEPTNLREHREGRHDDHRDHDRR